MAAVRPATSDDAAVIFEMLCDFAMSCRPDRAAFDVEYAVISENQMAELLVAETGEGVCGYALTANIPTLFANGRITELVELYVQPSRRGKGIGRQLVLEVTNRAAERGAVEVTAPTRRAAGFYRAIGFEGTAEYFKLRLPTAIGA